MNLPSHIYSRRGDAKDVLLLQSADSEDDAARHGCWERRWNRHSDEIEGSVDKDFDRNTKLYLQWNGRYDTNQGKKGHDSDELETIRVKSKLDVLRVENVSYQTSFRCQEASVFDECPYGLVSNRSRLND